MNLESIQGKLSRVEMKNIMAGSGYDNPCSNAGVTGWEYRGGQCYCDYATFSGPECTQPCESYCCGH